MRYATVFTLGLITSALAPVTAAHAQGGWTDAGATVHLTTSGDRVGIGTTAPSTKLHVVGGARVDGTVSSNVISSRGGSDLQLRAEGVGALRLEATAGAPNVIGGASINAVFPGVEGAAICGGGDPDPEPQASRPNFVADDFG